MARDSRLRDLRQIESDLQTGSYQMLLAQLQQEEPILKRFRTWTEVLSPLRQGGVRDPMKDEILRPILRARARDRDTRWQSVLVAAFWPRLESIHTWKREWDRESGDRWQNVVLTFLEVLDRIDLTRRPERLAQKLVNDTLHHLYEKYQRAWRRTSHEFGTPAEKLERLAGGREDATFQRLCLREAQERELKRLRGHRSAGRLSESDFPLFVARRIYGWSDADYARWAGLTREAVKKRRQRAEAAIRRSEAEVR